MHSEVLARSGWRPRCSKAARGKQGPTLRKPDVDVALGATRPVQSYCTGVPDVGHYDLGTDPELLNPFVTFVFSVVKCPCAAVLVAER